MPNTLQVDEVPSRTGFDSACLDSAFGHLPWPSSRNKVQSVLDIEEGGSRSPRLRTPPQLTREAGSPSDPSLRRGAAAAACIMPSPIQSVPTVDSSTSDAASTPSIKLPDPVLPVKAGYTSPVLLAVTETARALSSPVDGMPPLRSVSAPARAKLESQHHLSSPCASSPTLALDPPIRSLSISPLRSEAPSARTRGLPVSDPEIDGEASPTSPNRVGPSPARRRSQCGPVCEISPLGTDALAVHEPPVSPAVQTPPLNPTLAKVLGSSLDGELPALPTPEIHQQHPSRSLSSPPKTRDTLLVFKHNAKGAFHGAPSAAEVGNKAMTPGKKHAKSQTDDAQARAKSKSLDMFVPTPTSGPGEDEEAMFDVARLFMGGGSPLGATTPKAAALTPKGRSSRDEVNHATRLWLDQCA